MSRLRELANGLPDGATVQITRGDLLELLAEVEPSTAPARDLTVEDVAASLGRSCNSVRRWLAAGDLRGYRLQGRAWRVPAGALEDFRNGVRPPTTPTPDLGSWRRHRSPTPRRIT
jgi:excisionase family DNA binding protein